MSTKPLSIPDILRGLILINGLSHLEAALRSGISPATAASLTERTPMPLQTWMRLLACLEARLVITAQGQEWPVAMPRIAAPVVAHAWQSWRRRREVTTVNQLMRADRKAKRSQIEARAREYAANEEERLRERFTSLRRHLRSLGGHHRADGLRAALQTLANKAEVKPEELSLLSGASLTACQLALGESGDGRLATAHRLLSALNARLHVVLPDGRIEIALCSPGDWRPGMAAEADTPDGEDDAGPTSRAAPSAPNRSKLAAEEILKLYDTGLSIGDIARRAGVSRQRVHKLAMDQGRPQRRVSARDARISEGREVLRLDA